MASRSSGITIGLTLLGALPFYLLVFLPHVLVAALVANPQDAFRGYGAVIASFMAGTVWGGSQRDEQAPALLIFLSNVMALAAWGSLLLPLAAIHGWLALQLVVFVSLLGVDGMMWRAEAISEWYFRLRVVVTTLVAISYVSGLLIW